MSHPVNAMIIGHWRLFWGTLKEEKYRLNTFEPYEELTEATDEYIRFYNKERVTLSMGVRILS
ncbi:IS3 family transposase [Facklamia miroungae]|uniref:IS3 family transposase n=2 Tax=Facklamia miroungae TaxID=120956 RepID=UPI000B7E3B6A